jgi:hypothetical protein
MREMIEPVVPKLAKLCRARVKVASPLDLGATPAGNRRIVAILGGTIEGQRLRGEIVPGGADWQVVQEDGTALLEARYTVRTHDGALIYVRNAGIRRGPREVLARIAAGEPVDPREYYFRSSPVFETGDSRYAWLNGIVAVCSAVRLKDEVVLDFYAVD